MGGFSRDWVLLLLVIHRNPLNCVRNLNIKQIYQAESPHGVDCSEGSVPIAFEWCGQSLLFSELGGETLGCLPSVLVDSQIGGGWRWSLEELLELVWSGTSGAGLVQPLPRQGHKEPATEDSGVLGVSRDGISRVLKCCFLIVWN